MKDIEQGMWSVRRLNRLARELDADSYLEIGLAEGHTFRHVQVRARWGVDPVLQESVRAVGRAAEGEGNGSVALFERTSDEFFAEIDAREAFDLVFVDGLHVFEQAYRDLCNSLAHAHGRTVILIDDTKPSDVFSSLRDGPRALAERRKAGLDGAEWHGDVYKVVAMIHDFHPGLDYRTIVGSGNPQTLVWKCRPERREPRFASLEQISRLTFFDLGEMPELLRPAWEDEAIAACVGAVRPLPKAGSAG